MAEQDDAFEFSNSNALELQQLHKSRLLQLETTELLKVIQYKDIDAFVATSADLVEQIQSILEELPPVTKACPLSTMSDKTLEAHDFESDSLHDVVPVLPSFAYVKPSGNAHVLPTLHYVIPLSVGQGKDYLNGRVLDKLRTWTWHIHHFLENKKVGQVELQMDYDERRPPSILITPQPKKKKKAKFRLQLVLGMENINWIPAPRLLPNRSNVKINHNTEATPIYNSILTGCDVCFYRDLWRHDDDLPVRLLQDSLALLNVWMCQRGLLRNHDGLTSRDLLVVLIYLYRNKELKRTMTPVTALVVVWQFWMSDRFTNSVNVMPKLKDGKCLTEKATMQTSEMNEVYQQCRQLHEPESLEELWLDQGGPVLLDPTMKHNYLAQLSPNFCQMIKQESRASLKSMSLLDDSPKESRPMQGLFMETRRFWDRYDCYFRIPLEKKWHKPKPLWEIQSDVAKMERKCRALYHVLKKALGNRVDEIRILTTGNGEIGSGDSDQFPSLQDLTNKSPIGHKELVVGLKLNPAYSHGVVDRGPPSDDIQANKAFASLWGSKAQLRRFKDGAIVHAVVWNDVMEGQYQQGEKVMGHIVERIVQHIVMLHFSSVKPEFVLRDMQCLVDGLHGAEDNALVTHKQVMSSFDALAEFLKQHSQQDANNKSGLPLTIDAVEPLCPALRYTQLFPPLPHPLLGGSSRNDDKISTVISRPPLLIQIRFSPSSKWPSDLKAMQAAKTAMLIQLADSMERVSQDFHSVHVFPDFLDVGFQGYSWRVMVRADAELKLLRSLVQPSAEAVLLLQSLVRTHVVSAAHHTAVVAVHTLHPAFAAVARMSKRWVASHLLSDLIPTEAIELLVMHAFCVDPFTAPSSLVSGFMRFLNLLASHDWAREPLIVDPQGHLSEDDVSAIKSQFDTCRGPKYENGPAMHIISPNDGQDMEDKQEGLESVSVKNANSNSPEVSHKCWTPSFTHSNPEWVVLTRAAALARRSHDFLKKCMRDSSLNWMAVFQETTTSLKSYSVLLRIDPDFIVDKGCSSTGIGDGLYPRRDNVEVLESTYTRSMRSRHLGPRALRRRRYRNLSNISRQDVVLHDWNPVQAMVRSFRKRFGPLALFFYNDATPDVVALLWRPKVFVPQPLSIMRSEYKKPIADANWKSDSLVVNNVQEILMEMRQFTKDIVIDVKVVDDEVSLQAKRGKKRKTSNDDESRTSDEGSQ